MMIKMKVTGLTIDPFTNMPFIILKDLKEQNAIPIWIGLIEASAIAARLENIKLSRPMTHDLFKDVLDKTNLKVLKVEITEIKDNTFYALLYLESEGKEIAIDSRPSDAIALALRTDAPIFVAKEVIEKARKVDLTEKSHDKSEKEKWTEILENLSPEDFGKYKM